MGYMHVRGRSPLDLDQQKALAARVQSYMSLPLRSRAGQIEEVARAFGVSARTGYRYAKAMREHRCYCAVCGKGTGQP